MPSHNQQSTNIDLRRDLESALPPILTVDEAAGVLRVDPRTIRRRIACGQLTRVPGGLCRVTRASLIAYIGGKP